MNSRPDSLPAQLRAQIQSQNLPIPSQTWLQDIVAARNPPPPLPSLLMTAKTRLLASDLTTPGLLDPSDSQNFSFPSTLANLAVKEMHLAADVHVQVLGVDNLSRSKWDQVEELEAIERGEQTRGREIIRLPVHSNDTEDQSNPDPRGAASDSPGASKNATHRLVLQDYRGQKLYALEMIRMPEISVGSLNIGAKMLIKRGTTVARGTILLEPHKCLVLGGKVETWQKAWGEGRLVELKGSLSGANDA